MSTMNVYSYTDEDLQRFANQVKEVLLGELYCDGTINHESREEHESFAASYVVAVSRPGVFGRLWDKLNGAEEGGRITIFRSTPPSQREPAPVIKLVGGEGDE